MLLLAQQQPVATDLRVVVSALRISSSLERACRSVWRAISSPPRRQVDMTMKHSAPTPTGNHPPCGTCSRLEAKYAPSITRKTARNSSAAPSGQWPRSRATKNASTVVTTIAVLTLMP